jgi:hypothetical protein
MMSYVDKSIDFSEVTTVGVDETSNKRGHNYITIFVDLKKSKVKLIKENKKPQSPLFLRKD